MSLDVLRTSGRTIAMGEKREILRDGKPVPYRGSETWCNKIDTWKRFGRFTPSPMFSQKTHLIPKGEVLATYGNAAIIRKTERSKPAADGPPFPT